MYKDLKFGLFQRSAFYGAAGSAGVIADLIIFQVLSSFVELWILVNIISYSIGTIVSYKINSKITFKSHSYKLSMLRFFLTALLGAVTSTSIIGLLHLLNVETSNSKLIATALVVSFQYIVNTKFSLVPKKNE